MPLSNIKMVVFQIKMVSKLISRKNKAFLKMGYFIRSPFEVLGGALKSIGFFHGLDILVHKILRFIRHKCKYFSFEFELFEDILKIIVLWG